MDSQSEFHGMFPFPESLPKVALVTGGAVRLGRAIALSLARAGFDVAIHVRQNTTESQETLEEIRGLGRQSIVLAADLSSTTAVHQLIAQAQSILGHVGVLVNNASAFDRDEWYDVTEESWQNHMQPNLWAPFQLIQQFAKALPLDYEGVVINMLDQRVWSLTPHFVSYTVSKSALWTLTQTMALALAPKSIRVNAIGPGPALAHKRQSAEQFSRQCQSLPLKKGTTPEEVARAVLSLISMPSVTGQMLALDGGQHLQWSPAEGSYENE